MKLQHKYVHLWAESRLLAELRDADKNVKPLKTYVAQIRKFAMTKGKPGSEEFNNTYGWMGEVLCEFWLKLFGHRYDIMEVTDTSENQYTRGYDFTARSFFAEELKAQIQVKMRGDPSKQFLLKDLYTFFDEGHKAGILPQYLVLMVPTTALTEEDILSYRGGFKSIYLPRIRVITQEIMLHEMHRLPSIRGLGGVEEFFTRFREAVTTPAQVTS
jgi:hypothetical protein